MRIESIIVRDPDGDVEEHLFLDGQPVVAEEHRIDAGRGWTWEEWCEHRDDMLATASPAVADRLREVLADPPGGKYVTGRNDQPWLQPPHTGEQ